MAGEAAAVATSAAGEASSAAMGVVGGVASLITSLGRLALNIFGGNKDTRSWTAETFEGVADATNAGRYDSSEGNLFGIGACVLILIIFAIILIFSKK